MRTGWKTVTLGDVSIVGAGNSAPQDKRLFEGGTFPFVRTSDVGKIRVGELYAAQDHLNEAGIQKLKLHRAGTILMPKSGASTFLDHRVILGVDAYVSSHLATLWPKEGIVDGRYLFWVSQQIVASEVASDTSYPTLSLEQIRAIEIPLPPLEEQRQIVAVLDEAFAAIATATANAEKNLANARELAGSVVSEALRNLPTGTQSAALETFCEAGRIITYGVIKLGDHIVDGVPCLRTSNVRWLEFELDGMKFIKPALSQDYRRTILRGSEVLVNVRGTLGGVAVANEGMAGWNVSREVAVVPSASARIDPQFLAFWIGSEESQKWLTGVLKGAAYTGINISDLRTLQVPLLPVPLQQAIVSRISEELGEARALSRTYEAKIGRLNALRQSLLDRAFAGELTSKAAAVVALNDNFATPEFAAKIVAFAYERHVAKNRVRNFGTVKAEKILHMVEAIGGIDLGRQPLREAAGPDDAKHRHATWDWARSQQFFRFNKRSSGGHDFEKLSSYSGMIEDARTAVAGSLAEKAIELLVDMDRDFAELIATTYAAWNNLIIDQCAATDDDIVLAARDKWHRDKLRFNPSRFHDAIRFIRNNSIVPDGTAKRVGGQEALLF